MDLVLISLKLPLVFYNTSLDTRNSPVAGQTSRAIKMHYFGKNIGRVWNCSWPSYSTL